MFLTVIKKGKTNPYSFKRMKLWVWFGVCLFSFFLLWHWRSGIAAMGTGLDMSNFSAQGFATKYNIQWGQDIIFPYGPFWCLYDMGMILEWLDVEYLKLFQICYNGLFAALKTIILIVLIHNFVGKSKAIATVIATVWIFICNNMICNAAYFTLLGTLLLIENFQILHSEGGLENCKGRFLYFDILQVLLFSFAPMIKFSYFYLLLTWLIFSTAMLIWYKHGKVVVFNLLGVVVSMICFWIIGGQNPKYLSSWIYYTLQLGGGYSEGMQYGKFLANEFYMVFLFALLTIGICLIIFLRSIQKKAWTIAVPLIFFSPICFVEFKEAFVRADMHVYVFRNFFPVIALFFVYILCTKSNIKELLSIKYGEYFVTIMACLLIAFNLSINSTEALFSYFQPTNDYWSYHENIGYGTRYVEAQKRDMADVSRLYGNSDILSLISPDETVDVYPTEYNMLFSNGLNYTPRRVTQSFCSFSAEMDKWSSDSVVQDKIVYSFETIDGRYPLFDEPATMRQILLNYEVAASNDSYLLLERTASQGEAVKEIRGEQQVKVNSDIKIPQVDGQYIFMHVDWDMTLLGKLINLIFRVPITNIILTTEDGAEYVYRFVRGSAENGLYVTNLVSSTADMCDVFDGKVEQDIQSVRIEGNTLFYKNDMTVSFSAVPIEIRENPYIRISFNEDSAASNQSSQVFFDTGKGFCEDSSIQAVATADNSRTFYIRNQKYAMAEKLRLDPVNSDEIVAIKSIEIGDGQFKTVILAADIPQYFDFTNITRWEYNRDGNLVLWEESGDPILQANDKFMSLFWMRTGGQES